MATLVQNVSEYDIEKEIQAFSESKTGVKGLVDGGAVKVPPFFAVPEHEATSQLCPAHLQIPVIDLKDIHEDNIRRTKIVEQIRNASEIWGFFQVVNHGISQQVMEKMMEGMRSFHEEKEETKIKYHATDMKKKIRFISNPLVRRSKVANWKDTLYLHMAPQSPYPENIPSACREISLKYSEEIRGLGATLLELLSEALGLKPNHLIDLDCANQVKIMGHYSPACPEPKQTLASSPHKDPDFFTIVMQDHISGLQVFHQNQWIDVPPVAKAFVVNIGDMMQLVSNHKFTSAEHRVLANNIGPRISVVTFFTTIDGTYGPIKELISAENPPLYKEVPMSDYMAQYTSKVLHGGDTSAILGHFGF